MQAERASPDRCPRCGQGFACGAAGDAPCACTSVSLSPEMQAQLRAHYTGCLCLHCLKSVALGAEVANPTPHTPVA